MAMLPFALQLYSVRDHLERDSEGALAKVKAMGYDHVEIAGTSGKSADEYKAMLDRIGLNPISMHVGYDALTGNLDAVIADLRTFGLHFAVVPWLGPPFCPDKAGWIAAAEAMDAAGARLREEGIRLCYHNHAHEFERIDGEYILDLIFNHTKPENLASQLDTCWAHVGGANPLTMMQKYCGRVPLLHIKDYTGTRDAEGRVTFVEVGCGCMNWDPIFDAAASCGVEWLIVEQDESQGDSLESAAISARFMAERT
ncbi:MAG TPA: sugar phosphate isomerase/epimerase [Candidatus Hydrogenedentes bacterium]|nr:sugar phosphate isomerase/epimerase [Candidatus Hydrogenedentota bacterium]